MQELVRAVFTGNLSTSHNHYSYCRSRERHELSGSPLLLRLAQPRPTARGQPTPRSSIKKKQERFRDLAVSSGRYTCRWGSFGSSIDRSIRGTAWYNVGVNAIQLFDRILDPVTDAFTPEVARRIVDLKADPEMQSRIDELATKSSDGSLTEEEVAEYKSFVDVIDLISVLQAKSQRVLNASR